MGFSVIEALRRFLPDFLRGKPALDPARWRAIRAITHCRTAVMGGHMHVCTQCNEHHYVYHSCNHRCCPQCGRQATAEWVQRELQKRIGAPYFMVTFTLPGQLRGLFAGEFAKPAYDLFFKAAADALAGTLANPRWLGATSSGFTMVLHTWNQRLHFHPHLHCIVPGAGIDRDGRVVSVKSAGFLVPQPVLRKHFRECFRQRLAALGQTQPSPPIDPSVWSIDWGVHLQPFGDGANAIKYLGAYVCRTAIGDARITEVSATHVRFRWKDRANGGASRTETLTGVEFVERYLRHVLPGKLRAVRHYGFCHPAAKAKRERVAFHTGCQLYSQPKQAATTDCSTTRVPQCPRCGSTAEPIRIRLQPLWKSGLSPPKLLCA